MKILLVGKYALDEQFSMDGFVNALATGLCDRGIEVRVIAAQALAGRVPVSQLNIRKWFYYIDKFLLFPGSLRRALDWADIVHICDQGNAFYMSYLKQMPHLLTCHDLLAVRAAQGDLPDWSIGASGRAYQQLILNGIRRARHIACVSECSRQDLIGIAGLSPDAIEVIYNGFYRPFTRLPEMESELALKELDLDSTEPFLLHVGGNQIYKNRMGVVRIYEALRRLHKVERFRLVMAGGPLPENIRRFIMEKGLAPYVIERIRPSDRQIHALYSRATALIFPSLYEGFGLPIIEAQACGCPVFTSDRAPMTEVGGSAAVYFDPAAPESAAAEIVRHLDDPGQMTVAGLENIKRFSTNAMLDSYMTAYERILQHSGT